MLSRHNIHVNGLTQLIKEKLEGFHDMGNVFVNFHVEFACSVTSSENLIDLLRLDHGVSCYHDSLYLRDELLASWVWKLSSEKSQQQVRVNLGCLLAEMNSREKGDEPAAWRLLEGIFVIQVSFDVCVETLWDVRWEWNAREAKVWDLEVASIDGLAFESHDASTDEVVDIELFRVLDSDTTWFVFKYGHIIFLSIHIVSI